MLMSNDIALKIYNIGGGHWYLHSRKIRYCKIANQHGNQFTDFCKKTKNFKVHHDSFWHPLDIIILLQLLFSKCMNFPFVCYLFDKRSLDGVEFTEHFVWNNYAYMFYISNLQCVKRIGFSFRKFNDPQRFYC